MTPLVKPAMKALVAAGVLAAGVETITDGRMYADHKWAFYVFGMDLLLLVLVLVQAYYQAKLNHEFRSCPGAKVHRDKEFGDRLAKLEGIAFERGVRVDTLERRGRSFAQRITILRDVAENQEKRIAEMEKILHLAHDRAVARLALRGAAFTEEE
jgi:hypothetical protein